MGLSVLEFPAVSWTKSASRKKVLAAPDLSPFSRFFSLGPEEGMGPLWPLPLSEEFIALLNVRLYRIHIQRKIQEIARKRV